MIICTKEVSVSARKNAYNLLVEIGNAFVRFCGNTKGNGALFEVKNPALIKFVMWLRGVKETVFVLQKPWSSI